MSYRATSWFPPRDLSPTATHALFYLAGQEKFQFTRKELSEYLDVQTGNLNRYFFDPFKGCSSVNGVIVGKVPKKAIYQINPYAIWTADPVLKASNQFAWLASLVFTEDRIVAKKYAEIHATVNEYKNSPKLEEALNSVCNDNIDWYRAAKRVHAVIMRGSYREKSFREWRKKS